MATVMDISMGYLVHKVTGPGATVEMKVQVMRPISEGIVTCEGRYAGEVYLLSSMAGRPFDVLH